MTIEKTFPSGALRVSELVKSDGVEFYESQLYMGFTEAEAVAGFRESCKAKGYEIIEEDW